MRRALTLTLLTGLLTGADAPRDNSAKSDMDKLQGTWATTMLERQGAEGSKQEAKDIKVIFQKDKVIFSRVGEERHEATYKLDPAQKPAAIDIKPVTGPEEGKTLMGIYSLDGDQLKICYYRNSKARPKEFDSKPNSDTVYLVLKREKRKAE